MESEVNEKQNVKSGLSLTQAKDYLQRNDLTKIAKQVGLTRGQVSNVLHGRSKNWKVVAKILALAEKNKALKERAEQI